MKITIRDVKGCFFAFTARQLLATVLLLADEADNCNAFVTHLFLSWLETPENTNFIMWWCFLAVQSFRQ
jgi:hypothetical protein